MPQTIHHIAFNSFQDLFAISGDFGIKVFNSNPIVELVNLKTEQIGSIKIVTLLNRANMIFMVAGDPYPKYSPKTVMVWDNEKQKFAAELTVGSPVLNVLVSLSRVIIVQQCHIHVFSMDGFKLLTHEETGNNQLGLCALSQNPKNEYLTFPSFKPGTIQVVNLRNVNQQRSIAPATINAHESEIVKLAMDNQATKIATGSVKGTLIRVFDTQTKKMIMELRRGQHFAQLFCLRFSPDSAFLSCSSDQGTLHVFDVDPSKRDELQKAPMKLVDHLPFTIGQQKSLKQFSMPFPEQIAECAFIARDEINTNLELIAITKDAHFYYFNGHGTKPQGYALLFNLSTDNEFWKL